MTHYQRIENKLQVSLPGNRTARTATGSSSLQQLETGKIFWQSFGMGSKSFFPFAAALLSWDFGNLLFRPIID
jgi:hypothetical protein